MNSAEEFRRIHDSVCALHAANFQRPAALATITRTYGSTFRRAGARMLIYADGEIVCALSGGCPQRDIVTRAYLAIEQDRPALARYNRESGLDILMEMGCGGELDVLIEPLRNAKDVEFLNAMLAQRATGFVASVFARNGDVLAPRPQRLVRIGDSVWNDIDDPVIAERIIAGIARRNDHSALDLQTIEGKDARFDVLIEGLRPAHALVLVGLNPASLALAHQGTALGWITTIVDNVDATAVPPSAPPGMRYVKADPGAIVALIDFDAHTSAVAMTFNIERDNAYLNVLKDSSLFYLGAIGSRQRSRQMQDAVRGGRIALHAPAGLDLGAETPEEIALSVAAELLAEINARSAARLSSCDVPLHS
jgi:xanthine dehydrogenase accessory factor